MSDTAPRNPDGTAASAANTAASPNRIPDRAELLARVRALAPFIRERATATEQARRMLPEMERAFTEAGLFNIVQPKAFGGYELPIDVLVDVNMEVARHSGSDAWILALVGLHNWVAGLWPVEAQREFFADRNYLRLPIALAPTGKAVAVQGGWLLSGSWGYASGVDIANWVGVAGMDPNVPAGAPPRVLTFIVPKAEVKVHDDWHVLGLRGTGSKTVSVNDAFVPARRAMSLGEAEARGAPGHVLNASPWFRGVPRVPIFAMSAVAVAVGVARGMCDDSAARAKGKKNLYLQKTQSDMVPSQLRLARANALVDAAETMLRHDIAEYMAMATTPERITLEVRARLRMHAAQELHFATEAVDTLFVDGGTSAMFDGSTLQRAFRDVHAIHSHVAMNHDNAAENFGRILLDLPPNSPLI